MLNETLNNKEIIAEDLVVSFAHSLQAQTPASPFRDFQLWALSEHNPKQVDWTKILGIPQFAYLTDTLLAGLVPNSTWDIVRRYAAIMNVYLMYETVSDNLAIGLYYHNADVKTVAARLDILTAFNTTAVDRLNGEQTATDALLAHIEEAAKHVSSFDHSLTKDEMGAFAKAFYLATQQHNAEAIAHSVVPPLCANIDTCLAVVEAIRDCKLADKVHQGLVYRYAAVNKQMTDELTLDELIDICTHTILVIPVLAYYIAVLAEIAEPCEGDWASSVELDEALYDAALLVRLLNDIGPNLLTDTAQRAHLYEQLDRSIQQGKGQGRTLIEVMEGVAHDTPQLTRLDKDIKHGEFNIGLMQIANAPATQASLEHFAETLNYLANVYAEHYQRMTVNVGRLQAMTGSEVIPQLVMRFVKFHEAIYAQRFDTQDGDYATKPVNSTAN